MAYRAAAAAVLFSSDWLQRHKDVATQPVAPTSAAMRRTTRRPKYARKLKGSTVPTRRPKDGELASDREADLVEQVRVTVLHEIGHHFGLDEDDLDDLGYG